MSTKAYRYRWFDIKPLNRNSIQRLAEGLLKLGYTDQTGFGFLVDEVRPTVLQARFITRDKVIKMIVGPDGESKEVAYEDYCKVGLRISAFSPALEVCNPTRRISELLSSIGEALDNTISIIPVVPSGLEWIEALGAGTGNVVLTRMAVSGITLTESISVKSIFSGTADVRKAASKHLGGRKIEIDNLGGTLSCGSDELAFKISKAGSFTFSSIPSDAALRLVRTAVQKVLADHQGS